MTHVYHILTIFLLGWIGYVLIWINKNLVRAVKLWAQARAFDLKQTKKDV